MGIMISLGLGFGVLSFIFFVDPAGPMSRYVYSVQHLRSNPVIYNIKELDLPILCYVSQHLDKRTRCLLLLRTKKKSWFLHTYEIPPNKTTR